MAHPHQTNVLAIISILIGVISIPLAFVCCIGFFTAIIGLGFGIASLVQANRGDAAGKKLAIAGIVVNILAPLIYLVVFLGVLAFAVTTEDQPPSLLDTDPFEQLDD